MGAARFTPTYMDWSRNCLLADHLIIETGVFTMSITQLAVEMSEAIDLIRLCESKAMENSSLSQEDAVSLANLDNCYIYDLIASANRVRIKYKGEEISLCSIINAKSGQCPEDCAFCSQSISANTDIQVFDLLSPEKIVQGAKDAQKNGAHKYGIVTAGYGFSGKGPKKNLSGVIDALEKLRSEVGIQRCASLGIINEQTATALKNAGVEEYHHNLETARSFFPNICTTHDYEEDVATVRAVKDAGLKACCGGIFGIGESNEQRVEMAFTIKELDVDSIPLNFLNPIKGTRLENAEPIEPIEALKIIAIYRLIFPDKDIKVAGGREKNLRDLQCMIFAAGANSTMVGNYLTTFGRPAKEDIQMISDLGLTIKGV